MGNDLGYSTPFDEGICFNNKKVTEKLLKHIGDEINVYEARGRKRDQVAQKVFNDNLTSILANLYNAYITDSELFLAVSMTKGTKAKPEDRYDSGNQLSRSFRTIINGLSDPELNYIEKHSGFYDAKTKVGKITRIKAKKKLIEIIEGSGLTSAYIEHNPMEPIILRVGSKRKNTQKDIEYADTLFTLDCPPSTPMAQSYSLNKRGF